MKKIIVTGGAGYIGSHTCKLLKKNGFDPITIDNLSTGHQSFVKWGDFFQCDITNTTKLTSLLKKIKPLAVIHFAASSNVGESMINPVKYYYNNLLGTISLIEAMQKSNVHKLVFSSTCATYGIPATNKITENTLQEPINPYGKSKLLTEKVLKDLSLLKKINFYSLRYFNAAGADDDLEVGELHDPETYLIPLAIKSGYHNSYVLKVFGNDYDTPDGSSIRDYIHVTDLAIAHYLSLENLLLKNNSDFINLGSGIGYSVFDIINNLKNLGIDIKYEIHGKRKGDQPKLVADISKAKRVLNWTPTYTIEKILHSANEWYKKINNL